VLQNACIVGQHAAGVIVPDYLQVICAVGSIAGVLAAKRHVFGGNISGSRALDHSPNFRSISLSHSERDDQERQHGTKDENSMSGGPRSYCFSDTHADSP
jgi:hypothetical protein